MKLASRMKYFFSGLALFVWQTIIFGQQNNLKPLVISSDTIREYELSRYLQVLPDSTGKLTFDQISSPALSNKFISLYLALNKDSSTLNKSKVCWCRLAIRSNLSYDKQWLLEDGGGDYLTLFYQDSSGNYFIKKTGEKVPLNERDFKYGRRAVFNIIAHRDKEEVYYMKVDYQHKVDKVRWGYLNYTRITSTEKFMKSELVNRYLFGAFFGVLFIMIVYNLILFLSVREKSYLIYVLYIFSLGLTILLTTGYGFEFLWPSHPEWLSGGWSAIFPITGAMFFYVLFGKVYLNTKKYLPKWNKVLIIQMAGVLICAIPFSIIKGNDSGVGNNSGVADWVLNIIAISWGLIGLSAFIVVLLPAIFILRKGFYPARFFLLGNLMLVCGAITGLLVDMGFPIGVVMEIIMFSIGIGHSVNELNKEKAKAQKETIRQLKENEQLKDKVNRELEQKVQERTFEVVKQKEIIEEKNHEITDSINYALRIQQAILPTKEEIKKAFPQSFILFKPKDIVSGDFYFFHCNKQSSIIAAADCTGHGVPGALMSMVGSEQLNDTVSLSENPSEILAHLNRGIKTSLRQSESAESTRDGMDIALCSVDTVNRIVKYAGANRPIWIIRKGNLEIEETKATKTAIGGLTEDNQVFVTHEFKLQQGDTFYICTDGYADQFSGQDKKLTTKKFKQILLEIQSKTMPDQEKHLDQFIEEWKTGIEQIDDILVIGIRL